MKFVAEVHIRQYGINLANNNALIGTFKTTPNNEGVGIFDFRPVIETFVNPDNLGSMGPQVHYVEPSTEGPYVIVRDNVCLVYNVSTNFANDTIIGCRLEVAQISLDQATLNQLLRTQTV